jgi:subtilisin-like proprotein convertase family protein
MTSAATPNKITNPGTGSPNLLEYTGTGTTPPGPGCAAVTNSTVTNIPDSGSITSALTVSGCSGNAGSASTVAVNITHTYRGDIVIDLIAPDGTTYRLKNSSSSDSADNVIATYSVNLSAKPANGVWKLKVADVYAADTGKLNSWTLDL